MVVIFTKSKIKVIPDTGLICTESGRELKFDGVEVTCEVDVDTAGIGVTCMESGRKLEFDGVQLIGVVQVETTPAALFMYCN